MIGHWVNSSMRKGLPRPWLMLTTPVRAAYLVILVWSGESPQDVGKRRVMTVTDNR